MFVANTKHHQKPLFNSTTLLPKKQLKRLEASWAGTFYKDVFCRIDEQTFAVLYSDKDSRPNVPVNVLLGLEILKDGNGWTDEEMYDNVCYNIQVRYALGLWDLAQGHFALRTVYNFRDKLVRHMQEEGENLIEVCFEQLTDEQMGAYEVKGQIQRVDSKQIASNIKKTSRLRLLVEIMQRVYRMLDASDKKQYHELFAPYVKKTSGQYIYQLKRGAYELHLNQIGQQMAQLLTKLLEKYKQDKVYQLLERAFADHFDVVIADTAEASTIAAKAPSDVSADSLQSPDDEEATFRRKQGKAYVGYVTNVTETVDPEGGLQLITKVQTASNLTDDAAMLDEALPELVKRTGVNTIYTDGAYCSPKVDATCQQEQVAQYPTAIRGAAPNPDAPHLTNFTIEIDDEGKPEQLTCPHGQPVELVQTAKPERYVARVAEAVCPLCAAHDKRQRVNQTVLCLVLYFSLPEVGIALRRQRMLSLRSSGKNPRAAVEASIHELTCRLEHGRLRVRGRCRVAMTMAAAAAMTNARRIWRYKQAKNVKSIETKQKMADMAPETLLWLPNLARWFDVAWSWHVRLQTKTFIFSFGVR